MEGRIQDAKNKIWRARAVRKHKKIRNGNLLSKLQRVQKQK